MEKHEILKKIKDLLHFRAKEDTEETQEIKYLDIPLDDATIRVEGDVLEVGLAVSTVSDDGETVTLIEDDSLDGDYIFDSNTFTIANGVITVVEPIDVEAEDLEDDKPADTEEFEAETEVEVEAEEEPKEPEYNYVTQVETLINRVSVYGEQIAEMRTIQEHFVSILEKYVGETPADTKPITQKFKTHITAENKLSTLESIRNIRKNK